MAQQTIVALNPWETDTTAPEFVEKVLGLDDAAVVYLQIVDPNDATKGIPQVITGANLKAAIRNFKGTWVANTAYYRGNIVIQSGNVQLCQTTNSDATFTQSKWYNLTEAVFSGNYADLTGKPTLFSGAYTDLTGKPTLFSGAYADLTGKPTLFSGAYADLTGKPTLFSGAYADLTGKPTLFSGAYADLTGKPTDAEIGSKAFSNPPSTLTAAQKASLQRAISAGILNKTADYTLVADDIEKIVVLGGTTARTFTLPDITGDVTTGWGVWIANGSTQDLTLDGNGSDTINGAATYTVSSGNAVRIAAVTASSWMVVCTTEGNGGGGTPRGAGAGLTLIGNTLNVTNPFTDANETKLNSIETNAEVNVQVDWDETDTNSDAYIENKPTDSEIGDKAFSNPPSDLTDTEKLAARSAIGVEAFGPDSQTTHQNLSGNTTILTNLNDTDRLEIYYKETGGTNFYTDSWTVRFGDVAGTNNTPMRRVLSASGNNYAILYYKSGSSLIFRQGGGLNTSNFLRISRYIHYYA